MAKRKLRVVNSDNSLLCVCEACSESFNSSSRDYEQAEREVKAQFDAHECKTAAGDEQGCGPTAPKN
jgi:ribosome-binding protein aMBF1 (putative translation factor)